MSRFEDKVPIVTAVLQESAASFAGNWVSMGSS
jgi:hypothetical protein